MILWFLILGCFPFVPSPIPCRADTYMFGLWKSVLGSGQSVCPFVTMHQWVLSSNKEQTRMFLTPWRQSQHHPRGNLVRSWYGTPSTFTYVWWYGISCHPYPNGCYPSTPSSAWTILDFAFVVTAILSLLLVRKSYWRRRLQSPLGKNRIFYVASSYGPG